MLLEIYVGQDGHRAALDATMIAAAAAQASPVVWPMALAISASLTRIGLTIHALPKPRTS